MTELIKDQNTYNTMLSAIESKVNNYNEAENIKNSTYNAWIASGGNTSSNDIQFTKRPKKFK